jgi:endonuclease/exonuclease/phosphatase (EEP) superfamily protein YafD
LAIVGWIVVAALGVVALMRIFAWDDVEVFAVLNTVAAFVYLPAWVVAIVAGLGRRFILAGAALLLVVAQLFFVLPEFTAAQPVPRWAATAPTIRLLDANVYYLNRTGMSGYASEIKAYDPQLVTMEEATPYLVGQLKATGALAGLPYDEEVSLFTPRAFFVASAYRLSGTHVVYSDGLPLIIETTINLPSGPQPLWVVHTTAPLPSSFGRWQAELALIAKLVKERGSRHLLLVGDFNSTWGNKSFRSILSDGMTDGAAARGQALDMTWSQIEHPLPPLVRIDHVLTGPGVAATKIHTDAGPGSDHRDLMATLAFKQ